MWTRAIILDGVGWGRLGGERLVSFPAQQQRECQLVRGVIYRTGWRYSLLVWCMAQCCGGSQYRHRGAFTHRSSSSTWLKVLEIQDFLRYTQSFLLYHRNVADYHTLHCRGTALSSDVHLWHAYLRGQCLNHRIL